MRMTLHGAMRVGIIHFMAYPQCGGGEGPVAETVGQLACDPFFEVIELTHIKDPSVRRQVRRTLEQTRVTAMFGAQPVLLGGRLDLGHAEPAERERAVEVIKGTIAEAEELGCVCLAVLSGKVSGDKASATARLVESLIELCRYGKARGVKLVLETFDQVAFGKNCLIGPTRDAVAVSEAVRRQCADFGLVLDLSHLPLLGETAQDAIQTAGDHLVHVHIGNCAMDDPAHEAYGDNHPRFGAPGTRNGVRELVEFLEVLLSTGYIGAASQGTVSFEVRPMKGEDPEAVIAGSKRTLADAWRLVKQDSRTAH